MRGRVFGIKKTDILKCTFFIALISTIVFTVLSCVLIKNYYCWFYGFCLMFGLHFLIKSWLFRLDSCCYYGSLLFFIGLSGILMLFTFLATYFVSMLIFSFFMASFLTFIFFRQYFHAFLSFFLFFAGVSQVLYEIKLIPFWISLAIGGVGVILFILKYLIFFKRSE